MFLGVLSKNYDSFGDDFFGTSKEKRCNTSRKSTCDWRKLRKKSGAVDGVDTNKCYQQHPEGLFSGFYVHTVHKSLQLVPEKPSVILTRS